MAKKTTKNDVQDDLASVLAESINKKIGGKAAYFLDVDRDNPSNIRDFVHTGSDMLDLAISNRPGGGMPVGRIVEIMGLEGSGKSLMASHLLKSTQDKGGLAVYIDTESAISEDYLQCIGLDLNKMMYVPMESIEDIFTTIETIIAKAREASSDKLITIVVDSVMGATTKVEQAADYDKDGYATTKAIVLSKAMRKITGLIAKEKILLVFTNQLRVKMNAMAFADPYTTSGGKAIGFHSSVRLRLSSMAKIKAPDAGGVNQVIGIKTKCVVAKNRLGPPHKSIEYDIYFDSGIDNYGGWLTMLKQYGIITGTKAKYTYKPLDGSEPVTFKSSNFVSDIISNPKLKEELYKRICDMYIMTYVPNQDGGIDDIIYDDSTELDVPTSTEPKTKDPLKDITPEDD